MQRMVRWMPRIVIVVALLATVYGSGGTARSAEEVKSLRPSELAIHGRAEVAPAVTPPAPQQSRLTIHGDPPDPTNVSDELKEIYKHIDENFDAHLERLVEWVRIPTISDIPEGQDAIRRSAEYIRDVIVKDLDCPAKIYYPGMADYGTGIEQFENPGNLVVYGRCDVGEERTIIDYVQGDVMPVWPEEDWPAPPFGVEIQERPPFKRVLVGRGAYNSKGPEMSQLNALISAKAVTGTLPVNVIFVVEHDEERQDMGLRAFMYDNADLFQDAEVMFAYEGSMRHDGRGEISGQSIGSMVFQLQTSAERMPQSSTAGGMAPGVGLYLPEQPTWRLWQAMQVFAEGSPLRQAFNEDVLPPSDEELAFMRREAEQGGGSYEDMVTLRNTVRVFITGTWGGNMASGYSGHHRPPVSTVKVDVRFPPNVEGKDLAQKIRSHLDAAGYQDVEMKLIGIIDWSWANADNDLGEATKRMYRQFNVPFNEPPNGNWIGAINGYGPPSMFTRHPLQIPVLRAGLGAGGGAHFAPRGEYYVIEGDRDKVFGFAGAMKAYITVLYNYAGKNPPASEGNR